MPALELDLKFDLKPFERGLQLIGDRASGRALEYAMAKAIAPLVQNAKARVVKKSGLLARAITSTIKTYPGAVVGIVGIDSDVRGTYKGRPRIPKYYAHLVEYGTKPHSLKRAADMKKVRAAANRALLKKLPKGEAQERYRTLLKDLDTAFRAAKRKKK